MAKKSRRVKKQGQVRLSAAQMVQPMADEVAEAVAVAIPTQSVLQETDLRDEYHYVITDLKRIGIIALAMLAVLVVLALLLT